jgi:molybdenum cofactor cytidylyltransferase
VVIYLIVLASGFSRRMGQPKLLLPWGSESLLRTVLKTAASIKGFEIGFKVVLNPQVPRLAEELEGIDAAEPVWNPEAEHGLSSSIRAGICSLPHDAQAAMFILADQPHLCASFMTGLLEKYRSNQKMIIQARYQGIPGHPVLFDRCWFPQLMALTGDRGAKMLLKANVGHIHYVDFHQPPMQDIDTPEDYRRLK